MAPQDTALGQVIWYDLRTPDIAASAEFICALTGWQTHTMDMGGVSYTMFMDGEEGIGGLEQHDGPGPGHWIGYVKVASLEATLASVEERGGSTVRPATPISETSGYATIDDAKGALSFVDDLTKDGLFHGRPYVHILDYSEFHGASREARRYFIEHVKLNERILGLIFYGISPDFRISIKLARRLQITNFKVHIVDGYPEAVRTALGLLSQEKSNDPEPACRVQSPQKAFYPQDKRQSG